MTQENKEILLKDLCARLPYGVKCNVPYLKDIRTLALIQYDAENTLFDFWDNNESYCRLQLFLSEFKPYLLPLSSMTEEQKREYNFWKYKVPICHYEYGDVVEEIELYDSPESFEYLIENHFDYRGLIEKGLAIDATGLEIY